MFTYYGCNLNKKASQYVIINRLHHDAFDHEVILLEKVLLHIFP